MALAAEAEAAPAAESAVALAEEAAAVPAAESAVAMAQRIDPCSGGRSGGGTGGRSRGGSLGGVDVCDSLRKPTCYRRHSSHGGVGFRNAAFLSWCPHCVVLSWPQITPS